VEAVNGEDLSNTDVNRLAFNIRAIFSDQATIS